MAYYVRLIEDITHIEKTRLCCEHNTFYCIEADVPTREFRTKQNTLSIWRIESLSDLDDAVCCITSMRSSIITTNFAIIPSDSIDGYFDVERTTPEGLPVVDPVSVHYDIQNVTFSQLIRVMSVIAAIAREDEAYEDGKYIVSYTTQELKDKLIALHNKDRLRLNKGLRKALGISA